MSSIPSVSITLNSASQASTKAPKDRGDAAEPVEKSGFAEALEAADQPHTETSGKSLPTEERPVSEVASGVHEAKPAEQIQVDLKALEVRREGGLTLITSNQPVSQDALIAFMQDQGFSRAEMAEALMARPDPSAALALGATMTAGDWLKSKVGADLGQLKIDPDAVPTNLADALAMQLTTPKPAMRISPVFEIFNVSDALPNIELTDEELDAPVLKLGDLIPGLASKGQSTGFAGSAGQGDSGSLFSQGERGAIEGQTQTPSTEAKDFRAFLADHLRRAETLRDLSDRLGQVLARQMSGQIGRGRWTLEMALHPAELGSIEIEMEMTERGLEANFRASQAVTRDLLMESMGRLKSWFEEGGIDVAYAGVSQDSGANHGGNPTGQEAKSGNAEDGVESSDASESDVEQYVFDGSKGLDVRV